MAEIEFPNNSKTKKTNISVKEKPRTQKVTSGKVALAKKSEARKLADVFIAKDMSSVMQYIFADVLVPMAQQTIVDMVQNGVAMLVYGDTRKTTPSGSRFAYGNCYNNSRPEPRGTVNVRTGLDYDSPVFASRMDAEEVLSTLESIIDQYGMASVSDLYDACDLSTSNYQLNKFGWTNLAMADVVRVREGYKLKLPKAVAL